MLTSYEFVQLGLLPLKPMLIGSVRRRLRHEIGVGDALLDVGGRTSPYTVGIPARVTVTDLPRESDVQHELGLGLDEAGLARLTNQRSNVEAVVLDDMVATKLQPDSFDGVACVEVIEHVDEDETFMRNLSAVAKPGAAVVLTTPNGIAKPIPGGDHRRHYRPEALVDLLSSSGLVVERIEFISLGGANRTRSLRSWNPKRPFQMVSSQGASVANRIETRRAPESELESKAAHLLVVAHKR